MKNKKISLAIIFVFLFAILYLIFAAKPLTKEYHFEPEWEINISNPIEETSANETFPFKISKKIGYFDADGKITLFKSYNQKAEISKDYFSVFNTDCSGATFFDKDGNEQGKIEISGFPYFSSNQIFVFIPGGCSFAKCDNTGKVKWSFEGVIPITAFAAKEKFCAIGLADGTIKVFDNQTGNMTLDYAPGGSDYPIILGLDISKNGNYIASVSGQKSQRFVLAKKENTQVKIISHDFLPDGLKTQTLVHFTNDEQNIIYNYANGLGIVNITGSFSTRLKISPHIISVEESNDLIFLLGKEKDLYSVYILERTNSLAGSFSFHASSAMIRASDDMLFIGKDNTLSKIKIIKQ